MNRSGHKRHFVSTLQPICPAATPGVAIAQALFMNCVRPREQSTHGRRNLRSARIATGIVRLAVCAALLAALPAREASAAVIQLVQSGTAVNNANGIQTITISSVDM